MKNIDIDLSFIALIIVLALWAARHDIRCYMGIDAACKIIEAEYQDKDEN